MQMLINVTQSQKNTSVGGEDENLGDRAAVGEGSADRDSVDDPLHKGRPWRWLDRRSTRARLTVGQGMLRRDRRAVQLQHDRAASRARELRGRAVQRRAHY